MRRKRKIWYQVEVPGKWWCGKGIGWVEDTDCRAASSVREMWTARKAFAHAEAQPSGTIVRRCFYKNGIKYFTEFEKENKNDKMD